MYFTGEYLRVLTPKTTNGLIPKLKDGQQVFKETHLPMSAKKKIEGRNNRLKKRGFGHLQAKIEVVKD